MSDEHCSYCGAYARSINIYDEPVCFFHYLATNTPLKNENYIEGEYVEVDEDEDPYLK